MAGTVLKRPITVRKQVGSTAPHAASKAKRKLSEVPGAAASAAKRQRSSTSFDRSALASVTPSRVEDVKAYKPLDFFCFYVEQALRKQLRKPGVHPYVSDHGFPPVNIKHEDNVKFVQKYLMSKAQKDRVMQMILIGAFQAPDQAFCMKEVLGPFLAGVRAHRKAQYRDLLKAGSSARCVNSHFQKLQDVVQARYVRDIDPKLIASGKRTGNVYGYGDKGIYNQEHQTAAFPGMTHPEGLRWKLEHWPLWLEKAVFPQIDTWPAADDYAGIRHLLETRYKKKLQDGINSKLLVGAGNERRIVDLFGGDEKHALSMLSQALLFADILNPADPKYRELRQVHGSGAGPFVVRGIWMDLHRMPSAFPAIDTRTFCPGFVGALNGAEACKLSEATGVDFDDWKSTPWGRFDAQVRFSAWLFALQRHVDTTASKRPELRKIAKAAGADLPLHCSELEASLCFMSRLVKMFEHPYGSQAWQAASRALGQGISKKKFAELFK
eukprot:gnl/TRDRNA2_/TRDRNA2_155734_c0_seq1.p1 gnl/TRDRNA2_/TRDRNA2_155734_c0~~gnl/TRDRNA2_/TRDRNA2_155734_c0_seq1.p1  ORF type:complete len:495 (+),score=90.87 gnl/TRDRNA2_/TRDRNA2_155734_c0_seq1:60-1544(+)